MRQHILPALKLTLLTIIFFCGIYTVFILAIAQAAPGRGRGKTVSVNGNVVGYELEGQSFTQDKYFWSRPSAVNYNAAGSAGSNKGPTNPEYLQQVRDRIDSFLVRNPGVKKEDIPVDLVTASGSGLDPDISVEAALVQVKRIAKTRKIDESKLISLVNEHIENPFLGFMGPKKVNVLRLNIALDELK